MGGEGQPGRRVGGVRGWGLGGGSMLTESPSSLPAVTNTTGGGGSGLTYRGTSGGSGLAFGGTMGSNALRFSSGTQKAYSMKTTSTTRRSVLH